MSSPWERDWVRTEEDNLGRPRDIRQEEEDRVRKLPYKVLSYLGLGQSAHDETQPQVRREMFRRLQNEVFTNLTENEKTALVEFTVWRQENLVTPHLKSKQPDSKV